MFINSSRVQKFRAKLCAKLPENCKTRYFKILPNVSKCSEKPSAFKISCKTMCKTPRKTLQNSILQNFAKRQQMFRNAFRVQNFVQNYVENSQKNSAKLNFSKFCQTLENVHKRIFTSKITRKTHSNVCTS